MCFLLYRLCYCVICLVFYYIFFFFKQKTAYELRISDWSSDVCSSDLDIFTLSSPAPVRVDIPVDQPGLPLVLRKTTSTQAAVPGDVVQYRIEVANRDTRRNTGTVTVQDLLPAGMRLRAETVRIDGVRVDALGIGRAHV